MENMQYQRQRGVRGSKRRVVVAETPTYDGPGLGKGKGTQAATISAAREVERSSKTAADQPFAHHPALGMGIYTTLPLRMSAPIRTASVPASRSSSASNTESQAAGIGTDDVRAVPRTPSKVNSEVSAAPPSYQESEGATAPEDDVSDFNAPPDTPSHVSSNFFGSFQPALDPYTTVNAATAPENTQYDFFDFEMASSNEISGLDDPFDFSTLESSPDSLPTSFGSFDASVSDCSILTSSGDAEILQDVVAIGDEAYKQRIRELEAAVAALTLACRTHAHDSARKDEVILAQETRIADLEGEFDYEQGLRELDRWYGEDDAMEG